MVQSPFYFSVIVFIVWDSMSFLSNEVTNLTIETSESAISKDNQKINVR